MLEIDVGALTVTLDIDPSFIRRDNWAGLINNDSPKLAAAFKQKDGLCCNSALFRCSYMFLSLFNG